MRPLVGTVIGAGLVVVLAAGPLGAQERPSGGGGGAGSGSGSQGGASDVRGGGGGGPTGASHGGDAGAARGPAGDSWSSYTPSSASGAPASSWSASSSGGNSSSSSSSSGSSYSGGSSMSDSSSSRMAVWRNLPRNEYREEFGTALDRAIPYGARPGPGPRPTPTPKRDPGPDKSPDGHAVERHPRVPPTSPGGGGSGDSYVGSWDSGWVDPWWYYGYGYGWMWGGYQSCLYGPCFGYYGYGSMAVSPTIARGSLRLKVTPTHAQVYVDGYYMGTVDQFDGAFQGLSLSSGPHHISVRLDGFETAAFDVNIDPRDTVTYRGELGTIRR